MCALNESVVMDSHHDNTKLLSSWNQIHQGVVYRNCEVPHREGLSWKDDFPGESHPLVRSPDEKIDLYPQIASLFIRQKKCLQSVYIFRAACPFWHQQTLMSQSSKYGDMTKIWKPQVALKVFWRKKKLSMKHYFQQHTVVVSLNCPLHEKHWSLVHPLTAFYTWNPTIRTP